MAGTPTPKPAAMSLVSAIKMTDGDFCVYFQNGVPLGTFEMGDDGFYEFWIDRSRSGYLTAYVLRGIADCLDRVNQAWCETLKSLEELSQRKVQD